MNGGDTGVGEEHIHQRDELGGGSGARTETSMGGTSATRQDRQSFACPNCGHELSMYTEPDGAGRAENVAARLADFFGSWFFLLFLALAIVAWLVVNVVVGLRDPRSSAVLDNLDVALAVVAAVQGPLILLAQRRAGERDRARDIEIFHIALNTEEDVHAVRTAIEQGTAGRGPSGGTLPQGDVP